LPDPAAPQDRAPFSVAESVQAYLDGGVDPAKLTIGLATYGHGWSGVESGQTHGAWQPTAGGIPATDAGNHLYATVVDEGPVFHDPTIGASWIHNETTGIFWSIDDPQSTAQKAAFIEDKGLGGGMWWDLTGDRGNELTGTLHAALAAARRGPVA
jgi:chitinase